MIPSPDPDPAVAAAAALRAAAHLRVVADGLGAAARLYPVWSAITWSGLAALEVSRLTTRQADRYRAVAEAFRQAAEALSAHAARLGPAVSLHRASLSAPVAAVPALRARSQEVVASSSFALAARLSALAATAPARPSFAARALLTAEDWRDEAAVGAGESAAALLGLAARGLGILRNPFTNRTLAEAHSAVTTLEAVSPGATAKALLDWDTWTTNPPRALGHLVPDLLGGSGAARTARIIADGKDVALQAAAARRLVEEEAAARAARARLHTEATATTVSRSAWRGPAGLRLPGPSAAVVERFHALSMAAEARITGTLYRLVHELGADLEGMPTRRKTLDSTLQKAARKPHPVPLDELDDVVRYTVVAGTKDYTTVAGRIGKALVERGFRPAGPPWNAWADARRYRGLNSKWIDPVSGVVFEVQFHTPGSWFATRLTHPWYEEMRVLRTRAERAPWDARIAAEYAKVPRPRGAESMTFPPAPGWLTPPPVPDHARAWAVVGALTPALATATHRDGPVIGERPRPG